MFNFEELEAKSPSEQSVDGAVNYRGEDAHERFTIAELRIVQETLRKSEGDEDSDVSCPGGGSSDTEDETSTNARYVPGCRAEKVRVRNRVRRRQQPDRVPSKAWLEPEEDIDPIREDASRVVLPPADEAGEAETQEELAKRRLNRLQKIDDRPISAVGDATRSAAPPSRPIGARSVGGRRLRMARGITVDSGAADPVMPRRMVRGRGNKIRSSKASRAGVHYVSATSNRIKNEGETDLHFDTEDGKQPNWTFQIAEVNKVLASVSYFVDHKHRVVFDQDDETGEDISFITDKSSGDVIKMRRDKNVWVIDAYIEEDAELGFTRPIAAP